ncbi:MAG: hypothetical protein EBR15_01195 [Gammaproteobacteria bacterium]|nr:hypothetical protein [Gammaproteobacteria bacterium]
MCEADPMLRAALDAIAGGMFSPLEPARHEPIVASLLAGGDRYLLLADYASYMRAQQRVDARYRDRTGWASSALRNIAAMAAFSSDRAIREYASRVWQVTPRR